MDYHNLDFTQMVRGFLWSLVVMWPLALLALCHTDLKTRGGRHNEEYLNIFFDAVPIMQMQSSALCDDALLFFIYFSQLVHICAHQPVLGSRCLEKRGGVKFIPGIWLGWELLLLFCIQRADLSTPSLSGNQSGVGSSHKGFHWS